MISSRAFLDTSRVDLSHIFCLCVFVFLSFANWTHQGLISHLCFLFVFVYLYLCLHLVVFYKLDTSRVYFSHMLFLCVFVFAFAVLSFANWTHQDLISHTCFVFVFVPLCLCFPQTGYHKGYFSLMFLLWAITYQGVNLFHGVLAEEP